MTKLRPSPPRSSIPSRPSKGNEGNASSRPAEAFNEAYYKRFYLDSRTRVRSSAAETRLASFVFGYLDHLGVPVRRVVDLGCGLGKWKGLLAKRHPRADYTGVEFSPYLCGKYGWNQGSAADFRGRGRYDLVLCQSVIQYLGDEDARRAVANMARLCRGAVYLEIITKRDWREHCDRKATDGKVHLREGAWYRDLLSPHFRNAGGGLFLPRDSGAVLYELESGWPE
jgi:SAM-dependent methyltransferase